MLTVLKNRWRVIRCVLRKRERERGKGKDYEDEVALDITQRIRVEKAALVERLF